MDPNSILKGNHRVVKWGSVKKKGVNMSSAQQRQKIQNGCGVAQARKIFYECKWMCCRKLKSNVFHARPCKGLLKGSCNQRLFRDEPMLMKSDDPYSCWSATHLNNMFLFYLPHSAGRREIGEWENQFPSFIVFLTPLLISSCTSSHLSPVQLTLRQLYPVTLSGPQITLHYHVALFHLAVCAMIQFILSNNENKWLLDYDCALLMDYWQLICVNPWLCCHLLKCVPLREWVCLCSY